MKNFKNRTAVVAASVGVLLCSATVGAAASQPSPTSPGPIVVGNNVHVSTAHPRWHHDEVILSVDPSNPRRMIACSIAIIAKTAQRSDVIYASQDGGKTWKPTLFMPGQSSDPICQFGVDGTAYYSVERLVPDYLDMFVSRDGGQSWSLSRRKLRSLEGYDRHFFAVDDTNGPYRGRVYVDAWFFVRTLDADNRESTFEGLGLYYTPDNGKTWSDTVRRLSRGYDERVDSPGNCDVFSDGSLACIYLQQMHHPATVTHDVRAARIMTAPPGGEILSPQLTVAENLNSDECPHLAIDRYSSGLLKDRMYAVWSSHGAQVKDIWSAYSDDRGHTWSKPVMVNDDNWDPRATRGDHDVPQIAVNRYGVVGVTWYDHREHPEGQNNRVRFSASLDGGETFLPSVAASTGTQTSGHGKHVEPMVLADSVGESSFMERQQRLHPQNSQVVSFSEGGDTAGLVAGRDATFWALWTDNRSGYDQMYAAPVEVHATSVRHGSAELSALDDISDKIFMNYSDVQISPSGTSASLNVQLENHSQVTLYGPLRGRLIALTSEVGSPTAANAQNGLKRLGAVWNFELQPGQSALRPGEVTKPTRFLFQFSSPQNKGSKGRSSGTTIPEVVNFDLQILGKLPTPAYR